MYPAFGDVYRFKFARGWEWIPEKGSIMTEKGGRTVVMEEQA